MRKNAWMVPLGMLFILTFVACGEAPTPTAVPKPTVITRVVEVPVAPTPSPIPEGGWVVQAITEEPEILNPILAADPASKAVLDLLYLGLVGPDPHTGELGGEIAAKWQFSDDGEQITFELRDDLRWSDGIPITAWDVKFTLEAIVSEHVDSPLKRVLVDVKSLRVLDDRRVQLNLVQPDCTLLANLTFGILPSHRFADDFSDLMDSPENTSPSVTSGPLTFETWKRGEHLKFPRNERYMNGAPHLDGIIYRVYPDQDEALEAFLAGEVHLIKLDRSSLSVVEAAILQGGSFVVRRILGDGYMFLGLNMADPAQPEPGWIDADDDGRFDINEPPNSSQQVNPIFGERLVRQAVAHAVDVQSIINQVMLGEAARTPANVLPGVKWAFNEVLDPYPYDPEKAEVLLEQAGWVDENKDGLREREGRRLRAVILTNVENDDRVQVAEMVSEDLSKLGFETELIVESWPTVLWKQLGQQFDIVVSEWSDLGFQPDDSAFWTYANDDPLGGLNFVSYYNSDVEREFQAASEGEGCEQGARIEHYQEIQQMIHEDLPYVFLFIPFDHLAWSGRLNGIDPGPWSLDHNFEEWYFSPTIGG